ncbi:MAG: DUF3822 family protein [Chitinophagaceae bacterium]
MKQLFHIENSQPGNAQQVLSLRLGEKHAGFAITDKTGDNCYQLTYCSSNDTGWNEKELLEFFAAYPILDRPFYDVLVAYDVPRNMLIPSVGLNQDEAGLFLDTAGNTGGSNITISETIPGWQLYNVFSVSKNIRECVEKKFPAAKTWHQDSLGIKNIAASTEQGIIQVDFRKDDFTVLVIRQHKFLAAQAFEYSTPEDVIYYLLKTCRQFSLSQQETELRLSGLVDKNSALFKELYQYFIHVEFREATWHLSSEYPAHFFTSFNDLARCAS